MKLDVQSHWVWNRTLPSTVSATLCWPWVSVACSYDTGLLLARTENKKTGGDQTHVIKQANL